MKGARAMKPFFLRLAALVLCALLSLVPPPPAPETPAAPRLRALLIGCDHFVTRESTAPAATFNVSLLAGALATDSRGYEVIRTEADTVTGLESLERSVAETFLDATGDDISLIYISTHGLYSPSAPLTNCALIFSDGDDESVVTAPEIKNLLDTVPGVKVVIFDACSSGAFIGKAGSFEEGYEFDALVLDDSAIPSARGLPVAERLERVFYLELDRNGIQMKFADGRPILP